MSAIYKCSHGELEAPCKICMKTRPSTAWISVEDRLPEEGAWVKLGMKSKASPTGWWESTAIYYVDEEGDGYWALVNYNGGKRLFHPDPEAMWQPLPTPPETKT